MSELRIQHVTHAFALAEPVSQLEPVRQRGQVLAWRVCTRDGPVLIKRIWADDELPWRDQLEAAMEVEALGVRAGIDTPQPIVPREPIFGTVALIRGHGLFRAFPFLQHRPLADSDDVTHWVGRTMALMHGLRRLDRRPAPNWWYGQFPPVTTEQWLTWLAQGEAHHCSWAPLLRDRLDFILGLARAVVRTFDATPPYVMSHRDVEPWNVLITDRGPVLIDWDTTGPESARLEAAYVFVVFARRGQAEPSEELIRRAHSAYVTAGGDPLIAKPGLLDRMIGVELARLESALGRSFDVQEADDKTRARLDRLPATVANVRRWEGIFARLEAR